jgi:hypothetical protein
LGAGLGGNFLEGRSVKEEPFRAQLAAQADKALEIGKQQAGLIASKQDLSKQLRVVITEGDRLATLLRSAIKQHYGIRAEKVAEFGVKPFRGKPRKAKPPVPKTPELPTTATSVPASTAK